MIFKSNVKMVLSFTSPTFFREVYIFFLDYTSLGAGLKAFLLETDFKFVLCWIDLDYDFLCGFCKVWRSLQSNSQRITQMEITI